RSLHCHAAAIPMFGDVRSELSRWEAVMSIKTILVPTGQHDGMPSALEDMTISIRQPRILRRRPTRKHGARSSLAEGGYCHGDRADTAEISRQQAHRVRS